MTAKEKAKALIDKFSNIEHCGIRHYPNQRYCDCDGGMNSYMAKQCALIAVDEILSVIKHTFYDKYYKYWEEVKSEIEKL